MIKAILAHGLNGEIGQEGDMPWGRSLPKDLEYFKEQTIGETILMGRKTFESLPFNLGLPIRYNIVLTNDHNTRSVSHGDGYFTEFCNMKILGMLIDPDEDLYLIGGGSVYKQMEHLIDEYHITTVRQSYPEADTFFKPDLSEFEKVGEELDVGNGELEASVQVWRRKM